MKHTYILGIYTGHTATACLLKDGEIIACVSEERFNHIKNFIGFPRQSIDWCLKFAGITGQDLDYVVSPAVFLAPIWVSEEVQKNAGIKILAFLYQVAGIVRKIWGKIIFLAPQLRFIGTFFYNLALQTVGRYSRSNENEYIAKYLGIPLNKVFPFDHHLTHAAAGYYASPFHNEKALVFTLDGEGDMHCSTVSIFEGKVIKRIAATSRENSLGNIYSGTTRFLGMKQGEDEYKVMGLAPYAKERNVLKAYKKMSNIIILDPKDKLKFYAKFNLHDTYDYLEKELKGTRFDVMAGMVQKLFEDIITEWIEYAIEKTKITTIICSGGVFMNVKANKKVGELVKVKRAFFMPSAGDESTSIGACYLGYIRVCEEQKLTPAIKPLKDLYLGPSFTDEEIEHFLKKGKYFDKYKIKYKKEIEKDLARLLCDSKVVARMAGRMEWGARSLGNRAILANPQNDKAIMIINEQLKDRDFWMPFAPTILAERMDDYCVNPKNIEAPYMATSFDSTPKARDDLRAAIHPYDFTLRPQILHADWNRDYYKIIKEFEKLTGIGGLLNTSFNLHGLPVVLGPKEAMHVFENSGLEYMALEHFLISKV